MKEYKVKMLDSLPADWSTVERVLLDETPWLTDYVPVTYGQVVFVRGDGFYCRMTCEERQVTVEIEDNGIGMTDEIRRHVFEKFFQGDPSHEKRGTGLALPSLAAWCSYAAEA